MGSYSVYETRGSVVTPLGSGSDEAHASGSVAFGKVEGKGSFYMGVTDNDGPKLSATLGGTANLVEVSGEAGIRNDYSHVLVQGDASVGLSAQGEVVASVANTGVSGEAFAGARASAAGEVTVAGFGLRGGVEGWAGAGAAGEAGWKYKDGKFEVNLGLGAAVGLGGKVNVGLALDFNEMGRTASALVDSVSSFFGGGSSSSSGVR